MTPEQIIYLIYGLMGYAGLTSVFIVMCFVWTPVACFLKARIIGGSVLFTKLKGLRMCDIKVGKMHGKGAIKTKGGVYYISKDSGVLIKKGKVPAFFIPSGVATTVNLDALALFDTLEKETNTTIDTYESYVHALQAYALKHPDKKIHIPAYKSICFRDLDEIFSRNINVDLQEAAMAIERKKASLMDKFNMTHAMMIFIILVGVGLAAVFINMAFGGDEACNCQCLVETIAQNVTALSGIRGG